MTDAHQLIQIQSQGDLDCVLHQVLKNFDGNVDEDVCVDVVFVVEDAVEEADADGDDEKSDVIAACAAKVC